MANRIKLTERKKQKKYTNTVDCCKRYGRLAQFEFYLLDSM